MLIEVVLLLLASIPLIPLVVDLSSALGASSSVIPTSIQKTRTTLTWSIHPTIKTTRSTSTMQHPVTTSHASTNHTSSRI